jgi:hypothetical protein
MSPQALAGEIMQPGSVQLLKVEGAMSASASMAEGHAVHCIMPSCTSGQTPASGKNVCSVCFWVCRQAHNEMRKEYMERQLQGGVSAEAGNMEGDNVPARAPGDGGQDDGAR